MIWGVGMNKVVKTLSLYGFAHLLVDALCITMLFSLQNLNNIREINYLSMIIYYNLIAFGTQPIIGFICDISKKPNLFALLGIGLVIVSIGFIYMPIICMILLGIGNSLFHIGGGVISFYTTPTKATGPGLFVAPGAIGVFLAAFFVNSWLAIFIMISLLLFVMLIASNIHSDIYFTTEKAYPEIHNKWTFVSILLLLVICVRAIIGGSLTFDWYYEIPSKMTVLLAIVLGKGLGGLLGDRYGFKRVGVWGLIISAVLLYFGSHVWVISLIGLFAFNLTMPITLTALAQLFKKYKGLAFGLTTLALVVGYLLHYIVGDIYTGNKVLTAIIILVSAVFLYIGLHQHKEIIKIGEPGELL